MSFSTLMPADPMARPKLRLWISRDLIGGTYFPPPVPRNGPAPRVRDTPNTLQNYSQTPAKVSAL